MDSPPLEQVKGVEPSYQAWEACVLPMNYTCVESSLSIARPGKKCKRKVSAFFALRARRNTWQPGAIEWNTRRRRLLVYGSAGHGCFVCPICDESEGARHSMGRQERQSDEVRGGNTMNERVVPGPVQDSCGIREAVCIHTKKIYDSCRDKDCIEDLRVYPTRSPRRSLTGP